VLREARRHRARGRRRGHGRRSGLLGRLDRLLRPRTGERLRRRRGDQASANGERNTRPNERAALGALLLFGVQEEPRISRQSQVSLTHGDASPTMSFTYAALRVPFRQDPEIPLVQQERELAVLSNTCSPIVLLSRMDT
jgi:hypothetical protein